MPRTLALIRAVQRQTAASSSTSPSIRGQHGFFGGVPTTRCSRSSNSLTHTPSFRASLGQVAVGAGGGGGGQARDLVMMMMG